MRNVFFFILITLLFFGCEKQEEIKIIKGSETSVLESGGLFKEEGQKAQIEVVAGSEEASTHNPFLTAEEEKATASDSGKFIPIDDLDVSAIIYSSSLSSRAVVDGRIIKIGDKIDDKEVVDITPEAVILENTQGRYIAKLKETLKQ